MDIQELREAEKSLVVAQWQLNDCDDPDLTEDQQQELYQIQAPIREAIRALNDLINKNKD